MKRVALSLAVFAFGFLAVAHGATVVIPRDYKPFKVKESQLVRLLASGIAGSQFKAKVEGPAEVDSENTEILVSNGQVLIGSTVKEFNLKPSGKGHVKVTITTTSPIPDVKPVEVVYAFDVE
ncbi:MAG: hypothetical protein P4L84_24315 [Isosphaeraceae bacterium]|nr:hypothetical protein [Isosphaeraceae bacterium]